MARPALFVLLLLAAGAAGFAAGTGSPDAVLPARAAPPPEPADPPSPAPAADEAAEPAPDRSAAGPSTGTISGSVCTPLGAPVPGVSVSASRKGISRKEAQVRTGADGRFALGPLPDAEYLVDAEAQGFEIDRCRRGLFRRPGQTCDFIASPVAPLDLRILLPDGTEPANAIVGWSYCEGADSAGSGAWTPADRILHLPPGAWFLTVTAGEAEEYRAADVPLAAADGPRAAMVRLAERKGLLCRPVLAAGGPVLDVLIAGAPLEAGKTAAEALAERLCVRRELRAGTPAVFWPDLTPGSWSVGAFAGLRLIASAAVDVGDGLTRIDLPMPSPARSDYVLVRAEGPRGEIPQDLGVRLRRGDVEPGLGCRCCRRGEQQEMPDGSILLWFPPDGGDGEWWVDAESEGVPLASVAFTRTPASEVRVRFPEPAYLEVAAEGIPEDSDDYRLQIEPASGVGGRGACLRGRRAIRLGPFVPGPARLSASRGGAEVPCSPGDVVLTAGLNRLTVRVAALADVVLLLDPEWRGAQVVLQGLDSRFDCWARAEGTEVRLEAVPPGRYRVEVRGDRTEIMELSVPAPPTVRFVPLKVDALRVDIQDPSGALAGMGFADGDLVVAVGAEPIRNLSGGWALLELAASKDREVFTVLRRGAEKALTVERPSFRGDLGGLFSPVAR